MVSLALEEILEAMAPVGEDALLHLLVQPTQEARVDAYRDTFLYACDGAHLQCIRARMSAYDVIRDINFSI